MQHVSKTTGKMGERHWQFLLYGKIAEKADGTCCTICLFCMILRGKVHQQIFLTYSKSKYVN